jgi:hypothetical protein
MSVDLDYRHIRQGEGGLGQLADTDTAEEPGMIIDLGDSQGEVEKKPGSPTVKVTHPDGSITIAFGKVKPKASKNGWFDNLVEDIDDDQLGIIANRLVTAIASDDDSRRQWVEDRARGIELLGLKLNTPRGDLAASTTLLEGISQVNHPMLLEAVLRFQANARGELLPTDGPVKNRVDDLNTQQATAAVGHNGGPPMPEDDDAEADLLETAFNHYLTAVAKEYIPDTDRMLFMLGFGGCTFKKVYNCPIRRRPVSESVDAVNIIVSNATTTLSNCGRITHEVSMRPSILKRMQILGAYRDVELGYNTPSTPNAAQEAANNTQGVTPANTDPEDADRILWECYCELDIPGYEHRHKGKETGLPLPYVVTIDKITNQILAIRRNYEKDDEMCMPKTYFVKFSFVPCMGFYDLGLLHILGNTTAAATAAWREMLDAGMFASFPGFLYAKPAGKQRTNQFRIPPGGGMPIDTNNMAIGDAVMPLPYKEPGVATMQLVENIVQTGQRVGGTAEVNVGEGKQDAPVGTTIALIEQATKVMDAVHKRLHASQAEEFQLLKERFVEDPEALWRFDKKMAAIWDKDRFMTALENADLVPQADPNTSSQMMRVMKAVAIKQLQAQNPAIYDPVAVDMRILKVIGVSNPEGLLTQNPQQGDNGEAAKAQATLAAKSMDVQQRDMQHQRQLAHDAANADADRQLKVLELQQRDALAGAQLNQKVQSDQMAHEHAQATLQSNEGLKQADLQVKDKGLALAAAQHAHQMQVQQDKTMADNQTAVFQNVQDNNTALQLNREKIEGEAGMQSQQIAHDQEQDEADRQFQAQQHHEDIALQAHEGEAARQHASHEAAEDRKHGIETEHVGLAKEAHKLHGAQAFEREKIGLQHDHDRVKMDHDSREAAEDRKIQAKKINQGGLKNGKGIGRGPTPKK